VINTKIRLFIPTLLMIALFIAGISHVSYLQYDSFQQQADTLTKKHKNALINLLDTQQRKNLELINSLNNNWRFLDRVTMHNIDKLLDEIVPYHDYMSFDIVTIYDLNGIIMARADSPGIFGKQDELYPLVIETAGNPGVRPSATMYNGKLLLFSLKRLEGNYGPVGILAVGEYLGQKMADDFAGEHQLSLKLYFDDNEVLSSLKSKEVSKIGKQRKTLIEFSNQVVGAAPLKGKLIEDISGTEEDFWSNLFVLTMGISIVSLAIIYASRRIILSTADSLDKARVLAEKRTSELKVAYDEIEHRVEERTAELKNANIKLEGEIVVRKKAESALSESHERLLMVLNSLDAIVYVADITTHEILFINKYTKDIFGDIEGKICWQALQSGQSGPCSFCSNDKLLTSEGRPAGTYRWEFQNTISHRWYYIQDRAIHWMDGRIVRMEIATDITEHIQAERFIKDILESVGEGFIVIDKDFRILSANKSFCKQVNLPVEDTIGKQCYEVSHHINSPCYEAGEHCPVKLTFETGKPHEVIHTHYDKDNKPVNVEIKSYAMKDESGEIISVIETINDISEKMKLESQLRHAQKMEAVGHLAGGVAHDFNNILTAIVGYGHLLKMKMKEEDPLLYNVDQILASVKRGAGLTQSLLAFSRKQVMNPKPANLNEVIESVYKLLKRLVSEDIELKTVPAKEDVTIMADSGQIEQVLMNLVTNARDAMPNGGTVSIETKRIELDDEFIKSHGFGTPGIYALITVCDTGIGMDKETKEKIFEPFFTTKELGKGTGLGLAIVFGIIKQHNGYINVYSEPGQGTTFRIYLPVIQAGVKDIKPDEQLTPPGGKETILLAEDDEPARKLTKIVLEEFGYTVIEAVDGKDVVEKFVKNKALIQLLILDVIMPKKDGKEAYEEIKKITPDMKAIFTSGYTADIIDQKGILQKGLNFISKPVAPQDLLRKIRELLDSEEEMS